MAKRWRTWRKRDDLLGVSKAEGLLGGDVGLDAGDARDRLDRGLGTANGLTLSTRSSIMLYTRDMRIIIVIHKNTATAWLKSLKIIYRISLSAAPRHQVDRDDLGAHGHIPLRHLRPTARGGAEVKAHLSSSCLDDFLMNPTDFDTLSASFGHEMPEIWARELWTWTRSCSSWPQNIKDSARSMPTSWISLKADRAR